MYIEVDNDLAQLALFPDPTQLSVAFSMKAGRGLGTGLGAGIY